MPENKNGSGIVEKITRENGKEVIVVIQLDPNGGPGEVIDVRRTKSFSSEQK